MLMVIQSNRKQSSRINGQATRNFNKTGNIFGISEYTYRKHWCLSGIKWTRKVSYDFKTLLRSLTVIKINLSLGQCTVEIPRSSLIGKVLQSFLSVCIWDSHIYKSLNWVAHDIIYIKLVHQILHRFKRWGPPSLPRAILMNGPHSCRC